METVKQTVKKDQVDKKGGVQVQILQFCLLLLREYQAILCAQSYFESPQLAIAANSSTSRPVNDTPGTLNRRREAAPAQVHLTTSIEDPSTLFSNDAGV